MWLSSPGRWWCDLRESRSSILWLLRHHRRGGGGLFRAFETRTCRPCRRRCCSGRNFCMSLRKALLVVMGPLFLFCSRYRRSLWSCLARIRASWFNIKNIIGKQGGQLNYIILCRTMSLLDLGSSLIKWRIDGFIILIETWVAIIPTSHMPAVLLVLGRPCR